MYNKFMIEICFVCTGNTCRSIMAERIAKKLAKQKKMTDVKFSSAGIYAKGENITKNSATALKQLGYDGRDRKSVKLKKVRDKVMYITATDEHKKFVNAKKMISFGDLAGEIIDPYGQDIEVYLETAKQIEQNVEVLLEKIKKLRGDL